jgi:hypothetical protein
MKTPISRFLLILIGFQLSAGLPLASALAPKANVDLLRDRLKEALTSPALKGWSVKDKGGDVSADKLLGQGAEDLTFIPPASEPSLKGTAIRSKAALNAARNGAVVVLSAVDVATNSAISDVVVASDASQEKILRAVKRLTTQMMEHALARQASSARPSAATKLAQGALDLLIPSAQAVGSLCTFLVGVLGLALTVIVVVALGFALLWLVNVIGALVLIATPFILIFGLLGVGITVEMQQSICGGRGD